MHGLSTKVPGSWLHGQTTCKNPACEQLRGKEPNEIAQKECSACKEERGARKLVALTPEDERFETKYEEARAVFANNDVKHHVNKHRARRWAQKHGVQLLWVPAIDRPKHPDLQQRPYLQEDKEEWLTYHDKKCGELYGMLPLALDMPSLFHRPY